MKTRKKKTSFGEMVNISWNNDEVEIMTFHSEGKYHTHDTPEEALLLSGNGWVVVGEEQREVTSIGETVKIPPETPHYMIPNGEMTMLIFYPEGGTLKECKTKMFSSPNL